MSRAASGDVDVESDASAVRDLSEREVRALTEYMIVLPPRLAPRADERSGLFHVTGESGASYTVDPVLGSCTCPDAKYRDWACKHAARVQFETGERPVPAWVDTDDVAHWRAFVDADPPVTRGSRARADGLGGRVDAPASRTAAERDEWVAAGEVATGLERAVVALGVAGARERHAATEGIRR